ncbi:hypothetical protein [Kitasatospora sp. NPDC098663]|uniref:hypothetical protein n=1 Tax=Kitasatospora sp. NPDC098663 TaxID=3364096 RepID=UPI003820E2A5
MAERIAVPLPIVGGVGHLSPGHRWLAEITRIWRLDDAEWRVAEHIAQAEDELAALLEAAENAPPTVRGSMGQPVANPLYAEIRAHRKSIADLKKQLDLPSELDEAMRIAKLEAAQNPRRPGRPSRSDVRYTVNDQIRAARLADGQPV